MIQEALIYAGVIAAAVGVIIGLMAIKPSTRKYLKYAWVLVPAVVVIFLIILGRKKRDKTKDEDLRDAITGIKEKLEEANLVSAIEVSAAKQSNADKLEELKKVTAISDDKERRKRLIDLAE